MTSYTPGPWEVNYGNTIGHIKSVAEHPKGMTPTVCRFDRELIAAVTISEDEALANANLIAAAPDLLEACKAFAKWFDGWCPSQKCCASSGLPVHELALAAITKAEGKQC